MIDIQKVRTEYSEGQDFIRSKKLRWVKQLVLMNNLRRGDQNLSSTMLFSYFNRVLSNLYDDKPQIDFVPSNDSDYRKVEALRKLQVHDYREMDKPSLDYSWLWDTLFFGRGYVETLRWDTEKLMMVPHVINPLVFIYDPFFSEPQQWRYYGKWLLKPGYAINEMIAEGIIEGIKSAAELPSGVESELWDYKIRTDQAKEGVAVSDLSPAPTDGIYQIYEHFTHDTDGTKWIIWTDKGQTKILRRYKIDLKDGENGKSLWPLVMKEAFKIAHSSLPISIPDIVEDKHRALNVLYNLMYSAAKDEANPLYVYDVDRVQDVSQLFQRQVKQHIPVKGDVNAGIAPLRTTPAMNQSLAMYVNLLKNESAESIGTANIASPLQRGKKTATQSALEQQTADLASSLQAKILSSGEKDFWSHWYQRYLRHGKEGDKKLITIESISGVTFENINIGDIKTKFPPRIDVKSAKDAEYKELVARRDFMQLFPVFTRSMTPDSMNNFMKHVFFPKFGVDTSTIELMLPKSQDEIQASRENEMLNDGKIAMIHATDDDEAHLYVHAMAKNTPETWAHRFAHEKQLARKKAAKVQSEQTQKGTPTPNPARVKDVTNEQGAVPLMGATATTTQNMGPIPVKNR